MRDKVSFMIRWASLVEGTEIFLYPAFSHASRFLLVGQPTTNINHAFFIYL